MRGDWSMYRQNLMGSGISMCKKKEDSSEEMDNNALGMQLQEQIKINGRLQSDLDRLQKTIQDQNEMIEKQFGKNIEITAKGKFNIAGETIQPTTLSNKLKKMFDDEWRNVMICLFRGDRELIGIQFLSKLLEDCQSFCKEKASDQLTRFVNPYPEETSNSVEEIVPSKEDQHNLYKLRSIIGQHEQTKRSIISLYARECKSSEDYCKVTEDIADNEEALECIDKYINNCCDVCWQCAISDPSVFLKFDVTGKRFDDVSDIFQEYHFKGPTDEIGQCNTVMQVVWPAVMMKAGIENTDILIENAKGYAIVYPSSAV